MLVMFYYMEEESYNLMKGQHILVDKEVLREIVKEAGIKKSDKVIEIGAGTGALTKELAKTGAKVVSFEIDSRFESALSSLNKGNAEIIFGDALRYKWHGFNKVISNIPYHLSESIILNAIKYRIEKLVLTVGERFKSKLDEDTKIGKITKLFYSYKPVMEIGSESFEPVPSTKSWLIVLDRKEKISIKDAELLLLLLSKGKIKNALSKVFISRGLTKRRARDKLSNLEITQDILDKPCLKITLPLLKKIEQVL